MSKVTVVITLYNKDPYINQAIKSVLDQTYNDWKLLIIDDKSTDGSLRLVQPFLKDPRITCIDLKKNIGQTNVLNYALTLINTDYLVQLDADDWLDKNALKLLINAAEAHPEAALIYGNHMSYLVDEDDSIIKKEPIILEQYSDRYDLLYRMNYAMVPRFYRTDKLLEVGGWMAQIKGDMIAEDVQITLRLTGKYDWVWIDEILYHRRRDQSNLEKFENTRPLRLKYRYDLYNQILLEWGNDYLPRWNLINENYYLERLVPNPQQGKNRQYTIVIPNFNHENTLNHAVISALQQTLQPETILIIDDASEDQSMVRLQSIKSPKIRIIELEKNVGISTVLNTVLQYINTPYFIQLDGDDWLENHAAERLIRCLDSNPQAAFSYGNHRLWEKGEDGKLNNVDQVIQPSFNDQYDLLLKLGSMLNPRCYRTDCVRDVGGWLTNDSWNGRYFEDARMIIRLASLFSWVHVGELLHNVRMDQEKSKAKIKYYNYLRKSFYEEMLVEWGGHYKAVWKTTSTGRIVLDKLESKNG